MEGDNKYREKGFGMSILVDHHDYYVTMLMPIMTSCRWRC
jgi:hypothetical protein